jgi:two-component system phosphate regulon sensor histidine kinase PhoR
MWRSRLFWHLFAAFGVLLCLAVGVLGMLVAGYVERNQMRDIEQRLLDKTLLFESLLRLYAQDPKAAPADQDLLKKLAALPRELPTRITFLDADGLVLADSSPRASREDPHGFRPEVDEARRLGRGVSVRNSTTVLEELMYVAQRCDIAGSPVGYLRVSMPLAGVRAHVAELQRLTWLAAAFIAVLGLGLAFWLARRFARPLSVLTEGAEKIAAGAYGHKVYLNGDDEVGQLTRTFNHMSERLAAQFAQLDEDRQQLRTVLSSMVEGVVAIDPQQRILFANDRAGQLLDFPIRQAVGRYLWEMVRQRAVQELARTAVATDENHCPEIQWTGPGQRNLSVQVARLPGAPTRGAVLVFHDTTALRRLERVRQEFVANVSHELKTPLAVIKACVETLLDGGADDPGYRGQFLERIAEQGERLHNLILDLLHLARIESATEVFTKEELALATIVAECQEKHRALAVKKNQKLELVASADAATAVLAWADEEAVRQILDNLVDNAVKYTPEGGAIEIRWGLRGPQVFLEVKDSGIGIGVADLPRIFERFYRVDKARSRELGGTGLGLSIVKHLAQAMGGQVTAESEPGQGTLFTVLLPRPESNATQLEP